MAKVCKGNLPRALCLSVAICLRGTHTSETAATAAEALCFFNGGASEH